jgi:hypothetical protein
LFNVVPADEDTQIGAMHRDDVAGLGALHETGGFGLRALLPFAGWGGGLRFVRRRGGL